MAEQKCIPAQVSSTTYRDGKPLRHVPSQIAREAGLANLKALESLTGWLPLKERQALLEKAFEAVKRYNTPPPGEPFLGDDGNTPYSDPGEFADQLAVEFRERLFELLGARDGEDGGYALLGEPSAVRAVF